MIFLVLVPIITTIIGMLAYRFQGKEREIFRIDLVQFVYLFVLSPAMFIWLKTFLFYLMRNELGISLTINEMFVIDTLFTIIAIFVMAGVSIHTLTKTFWIKRYHDPEFDLYHLSEYFHLWWSHILIWGGAMLLLSFVAIANVLTPFQLELSKVAFLIMELVACFAGVAFFIAIWMSDPGQGHFMRIMKLLLVFFSLIHIVIYFVFDPKFNSHYVGYWVGSAIFLTAAGIGGFFERYEKLSRFRKLLLHAGWGENKGIDLFKKK